MRAMERLPQTSHDRIRYAKDRLLEFRDACTETPEELLDCSTFVLWGKGARGTTITGDPCNRSNFSQTQWQEEIVSAGLSPAIAKVYTPWRARRGTQSVYHTVKGILNKLTPENHDVLAEQIVQAGISSAEDLVGVTLLIYNEAVLKPALYAKLYVHLSKALPEFTDLAGDEPITFQRILLNTCQVVFDGLDRLREVFKKLKKPEQSLVLDMEEKWAKVLTLGNIKLVGELFNQRMLKERIVQACILKLLKQEPEVAPSENVEALCLLFTTAGEQLEKRTESKFQIDAYFARLKMIGERTAVPLRIRFMVRDVLDMRSNKWVPRRDEVKPTTKPWPGALIVGPMGGAMKGPAGQARFGSSSMRAGGVGASVLALSRGGYGFMDELRSLPGTGSTKPVPEVWRKASVDKERLLSVAVASDLVKLQAPAFSGHQAATGAMPGFMVHDSFGMKSNKDDFNLRGLLQRVQMYGK